MRRLSLQMAGVGLVVAICLVTPQVGCSSKSYPAAPSPTLTSFTASPTLINLGDTVTLKAVYGNGGGSINHGVGNILNEKDLTVKPTTTTTYTILVTNLDGKTVSGSVTVEVLGVNSFTASPAIPTPGSPTQIMPIFSGVSAVVDQGIGPVTSGTPFTVSPTVATDYTLTVTNSAGVTITKVLPLSLAKPFTSVTELSSASGLTATAGACASATAAGTPVSSPPCP